MSTQAYQSSNTSSVMSREEFLAQFKAEGNNINYNAYKHNHNQHQHQNNHPQGLTRHRWAFLYNLNKLKQAKLTKLRFDQKALDDYQFANQCTFSPKTNRLPKYLDKQGDKTPNKLQKSSDNMLMRQNEWIHKLKMKNETLRQSNNNQITTQCNFHPVINTAASVDKLNFGDKVESVIQNYSSYKSYIERVNNQRKEKLNQSERYANRPGSGRGWKRGMLTTSNYDYSQHEYLAMKLSPKKSVDKLKNGKDSCNISKDKKIVITPNSDCRKKDKTTESNIAITEQTDYRNALHFLHKELLSINLMADE